MVHRPRTFTGYVLLLLVALGIGWMLTALQGLLSNPLLWAFFAIAGLIYLAVILYRRRVEAVRERAWVGSFSFAEAVASLHAREAKEILHERRPRAVEPTV
jgi:uncharacterized protein (DUF58 family)